VLVGEVFKVMTQVDRGLTIVNRFDRPLGLIKNLACHSLFKKNKVGSKNSRFRDCRKPGYMVLRYSSISQVASSSV
jgi:hypothetical protein